MPYGKAIELFLVNGSPDSIVTAELSNWNGKAIKIPRIDVPNCGREDITQAGVYFLFCKGDDGTEAVYIGEAENVKDRLVQRLPSGKGSILLEYSGDLYREGPEQGIDPLFGK